MIKSITAGKVARRIEKTLDVKKLLRTSGHWWNGNTDMELKETAGFVDLFTQDHQLSLSAARCIWSIFSNPDS
jgi:hypothetical protein